MRKLCMGMAWFILTLSVAKLHSIQILDVCLLVDKSKNLRRYQVEPADLAKYGRFGLGEALPFDNYFNLKSAYYMDMLDSLECAQIQKNLIKKVPTVICRLSLAKEQERQFQFPKSISQSFLDRVELANKEKKPLSHKIYDKNGTSLIIRYAIQYVKADQGQPTNSIQTAQPSNARAVSISDFGLFFLFLVSISR